MFEKKLPFGSTQDTISVTKEDADYAYVHLNLHRDILFIDGDAQCALLLPVEAIGLAEALLAAALYPHN